MDDDFTLEQELSINSSSLQRLRDAPEGKFLLELIVRVADEAYRKAAKAESEKEFHFQRGIIHFGDRLIAAWNADINRAEVVRKDLHRQHAITEKRQRLQMGQQSMPRPTFTKDGL